MSLPVMCTDTMNQHCNLGSPVEQQDEFYDNQYHKYVSYILHGSQSQDKKKLLYKIAYAIFGPPTESSENMDLESEINNPNLYLIGYRAKQEEKIREVFDKISAFEVNGSVQVSLILVVCIEPESRGLLYIKTKDDYLNLHNRKDLKTWKKLIFRIKHCFTIPKDPKEFLLADGDMEEIEEKKQEGYDCLCSIFIDNEGRVYETWDEYLNNNTEPKCAMITPQDGRYYKCNGQLQLISTTSPACNFTSRAARATDKASTVTSIGVVGVTVGACLTPVAPVVLTGALVTGVATGIYAAGRSIYHLTDRSNHQQSIGLNDREARSSWVTIISSTLGLGLSGAGKVIEKTAQTGNNLTRVGQILSKGYNTLSVANVIITVSSVGDNVYGIIMKKLNGEPVTAFEAFQTSCAVLFAVNAVYNFKSANSIIEESQAKTIDAQRSALGSNRQRKAYDKLFAETRRLEGDEIVGKTKFIKGMSNVDNPEKLLTTVGKVNKDLNKNQVRISLTSDGNINLNGQQKVTVDELSSMNKNDRAAYLSQVQPNNVNTPNVPTRIILSGASRFNIFNSSEEILNYYIPLSYNIINIITAEDISYEVTKYINNSVRSVVNSVLENLTLSQFHVIFSLFGYDAYTVLTKIGDLVCYVEENIDLQDMPIIVRIIDKLKSFFKDGKIIKEKVMRFIQTIMRNFQLSRQRTNYRYVLSKCSKCPGHHMRKKPIES